MVIRNRLLPFGKRFYAMNICGVIFAKGHCNPKILNHENIHTAQIRELAFLGFYLWYVAEWLLLLIRFRNFYEAYRNISFEREAYTHETDMEYLRKRKNYAFIKFLRFATR